MAISTYSELKTAVADWLNRADLTAAIPNFIQLAEAKFNRELRTRQQVKRAYATLTGQYIQIPTDWLEAINLQLNVTPVRVLDFVTLDQADRIRANRYGETNADAYTIVGEQLEVVPPVGANTEIDMTYYMKIPALSDGNPTNWLLTAWPDLYVYATLVHAAPYLREDERVALWKGMADQLLEEIRLSDERAKHSGGPLRARVRPIG
ncbi:MAG TPA: hypothetical protein VLA24_17770 [Pseudomonadales bacterium]|nr:hypothetical protein [Pseudomonadales bacterium]